MTPELGPTITAATIDSIYMTSSYLYNRQQKNAPIQRSWWQSLSRNVAVWESSRRIGENAWELLAPQQPEGYLKKICRLISVATNTTYLVQTWRRETTASRLKALDEKNTLNQLEIQEIQNKIKQDPLDESLQDQLDKKISVAQNDLNRYEETLNKQGSIHPWILPLQVTSILSDLPAQYKNDRTPLDNLKIWSKKNGQDLGITTMNVGLNFLSSPLTLKTSEDRMLALKKIANNS